MFNLNLWVQLTFSDIEGDSSLSNQQNPKTQKTHTVHAVYLHCCKVTVGLPVYLYFGFVHLYSLFLNK